MDKGCGMNPRDRQHQGHVIEAPVHETPIDSPAWLGAKGFEEPMARAKTRTRQPISGSLNTTTCHAE